MSHLRNPKTVYNFKICKFPLSSFPSCLSILPRHLRRWSGATQVLGMRVRIPPGQWMFCLFCVFVSGLYRGVLVAVATRGEKSLHKYMNLIKWKYTGSTLCNKTHKAYLRNSHSGVSQSSFNAANFKTQLMSIKVQATCITKR